MIDKTKCVHCKIYLTATEILENSTVSWPNQRWIHLKCPACRKYMHVEVSEDCLKLGDIDGAPGPCFMEASSLAVPGLKMQSNTSGITCTLEQIKYFFRAKK